MTIVTQANLHEVNGGTKARVITDSVSVVVVLTDGRTQFVTESLGAVYQLVSIIQKPMDTPLAIIPNVDHAMRA